MLAQARPRAPVYLGAPKIRELPGKASVRNCVGLGFKVFRCSYSTSFIVSYPDIHRVRGLGVSGLLNDVQLYLLVCTSWGVTGLANKKALNPINPKPLDPKPLNP